MNPLIPSPHRVLARAAEELGEHDQAVAAYRATALLDDTDPAGVHYHLARLLNRAARTTRPAAKFSSRSRKRRDFWMRIDCCSN